MARRSEGMAGAGDRIAFGGFIFALAFLAFLAGALLMLAQIFPYGPLNDAYRGARAAWDKASRYQDPFVTDFWFPASWPERGVTVHDPARAQAGYTLYTSGHDTVAMLVSMTGETVHEWRLPYSAVWDETAAVRDPQPDNFLYWRRAEVLPNGDLLAIYVAAGDSPWGYGLVRLDRDSKVVWRYLAQTHHDLDIAPNGNVYTLTHEVRNVTYDGLPQITVPRIDDSVVVLSPEGEELRRVSVMDALVRSDYRRLLDRIIWFNREDFIHTNAIEAVTAQEAAVFPFADEGQVLLSLRDIDSLVVLDLETEEIVWALRGPWLAQHDPDILPDGSILLFDNQGHFGPGGRSRVIEVDPATAGIQWQYTGTPDEPFQSDARAAQERLPNGNTLITESMTGRIFEVTRGGDIVWEYLNPIRATPPDGDRGVLVPIVSWAQRIVPETLDPEFRAWLER